MRARNFLRNIFAATAAFALIALAPIAMTPPRQAEAHPLGNFTINRYARVQLSADGVVVRYVLDMAEIPAFQELQAIDRDRNGSVDEAEGARYAATRAAALRDGLDLVIDGARVDLTYDAPALSFPEGQAGLKTLRLAVDFRGMLPAGWEEGLEATISDRNYSDRLGWKEIVVIGSSGVVLTASSATQADQSAELTSYPEVGLSSPLNVTSARFAFKAGEGVTPATLPSPEASSRTASPRSSDGFARLISRAELTPAFVGLSLLAAIAWGAAHALGPGHGKTIVAAYLVGARGTARHAVILGLTVTLTHTFVVVLLGVVTLFASHFVATENLYLWLSAGSGLMVVGVGGYLLLSRMRGLSSTRRVIRPATVAAAAGVFEGARWQPPAHLRARLGYEAHSHAGVAHSHEQAGAHFHPALGHDHGHGHSHLPSQPGLRGLIALGISGGLLPCPTALVVMLAAIALDRVAYGLVLISAFSLGLAGVLTGIGILLVYAHRILQGSGTLASLAARVPFSARALQVAPIGSAAVIFVAGVLLTSNALASI